MMSNRERLIGRWRRGKINIIIMIYKDIPFHHYETHTGFHVHI
jgi:hypothetical protein